MLRDDPEGWDGEGVGRGFRMGNTCTPMADSCQCVAKPIQYYKVIILQLKKKRRIAVFSQKQTKKLGSLKCMAFGRDLRLFSTSLLVHSRLTCDYGCQN